MSVEEQSSGKCKMGLGEKLLPKRAKHCSDLSMERGRSIDQCLCGVTRTAVQDIQHLLCMLLEILALDKNADTAKWKA